MSRKYKVKVNKKPPSEKDLNKFKNFNRLLVQYNQQHRHRRGRNKLLVWLNRLLPLLMIIVLILIILLLQRAFDETTAPAPPTPDQCTLPICPHNPHNKSASFGKNLADGNFRSQKFWFAI